MNVAIGTALLLSAFGQMDEEFHQDFRAEPELHEALSVFGPNAFEAIEQTPEGLQIVLPADRADTGAVGVQPKFRMSGDFEITAAYQLVDVETPASGIGSGFKIWGKIASTPPQMMTLAHLVSRSGVGSWVTIFAPVGPGKDLQMKYHAMPADLKTGWLRLVRTGSILSFQAAAAAAGGNERPQFQELYQTEVNPDDVEVVRIQANSHGASSGLSLRLLDLTIRSKKLPGYEVAEEVEDFELWVIAWIVVLSLLGAGGFVLWSRRGQPKTRSSEDTDA